jgi:hypothetical protein
VEVVVQLLVLAARLVLVVVEPEEHKRRDQTAQLI